MTAPVPLVIILQTYQPALLYLLIQLLAFAATVRLIKVDINTVHCHLLWGHAKGIVHS